MKKLATISRAVGKTIALTTALAFLLFVGFVLSAQTSPGYAAGGGKPAASPLYNDNVAYAPAPTPTPASAASTCAAHCRPARWSSERRAVTPGTSAICTISASNVI
jgi:hypothetical protein